MKTTPTLSAAEPYAIRSVGFSPVGHVSGPAGGGR